MHNDAIAADSHMQQHPQCTFRRLPKDMGNEEGAGMKGQVYGTLVDGWPTSEGSGNLVGVSEQPGGDY